MLVGYVSDERYVALPDVLLEFVGMERYIDQKCSALSYGQQKLVELAQVLMLDDPLLVPRAATIVREGAQEAPGVRDQGLTPHVSRSLKSSASNVSGVRPVISAYASSVRFWSLRYFW